MPTKAERRSSGSPQLTQGAFADIHLEIHELIAHGDKVILRFTNNGTNVAMESGLVRLSTISRMRSGHAWTARSPALRPNGQRCPIATWRMTLKAIALSMT